MTTPSRFHREFNGSRLGVTNLPELREQLRAALKSGFSKWDLLLWRMHNGKAKLFYLAGFLAKYEAQYPDLCAELKDRAEKDLKFPYEMLYVECFANGRAVVGKLEQRARTVYSISNLKKLIGLN